MTQTEGPDWQKIGANLGAARAAAKPELTQKEAAAKIGQERVQTVGDWEAGKYGFTIANLIALCRLYKVSADRVLDLLREPGIKPDHYVIDLAREQAILQAKTEQEVEEALAHEESGDLDAFTLGHPVPREFEVVTATEYKTRVESVRLKLQRLGTKKPRMGKTRGKERGSG